MLNYELDSEEEWAEQNGEDLDEADEDEDDSQEDEEVNGFIVADDYLSASEMGLSDEENPAN